MMLHTKYQDARHCGFRQEYFLCLPYISLCETCDPGAGQFLNPGALFEQYLVMLHVKYQDSRLCGFRHDFFMFSLYKPM